MKKYRILFNPHAGNGHGEEGAQTFGATLRDCEVRFDDITKIPPYPERRYLLSAAATVR